MDTIVEVEVEEHPLPPDTWGEAPQSKLSWVDDSAPTTGGAHTTAPPGFHPE